MDIARIRVKPSLREDGFLLVEKGVVCVGDPVSCGGTVATGDNSLQIG